MITASLSMTLPSWKSVIVNNSSVRIEDQWVVHNHRKSVIMNHSSVVNPNQNQWVVHNHRLVCEQTRNCLVSHCNWTVHYITAGNVGLKRHLVTVRVSGFPEWKATGYELRSNVRTTPHAVPPRHVSATVSPRLYRLVVMRALQLLL